MERICSLCNCAFVGVTKVLLYHNAQNKQYETTIVDVSFLQHHTACRLADFWHQRVKLL